MARTPPSRAIYHQFGNPLFLGALHAVSEQGAQCVVLARHSEQREAIERLALPNVTIPEQAIDSRSLLLEADLVLGAGGTMTREAALLGVPTFSLFAGATPAVDLWLEERGALSRLEDVSQLVPVRPRAREPHDLSVLRERADGLIGVFTEAVLDVAGAPAAVAA